MSRYSKKTVDVAIYATSFFLFWAYSGVIVRYYKSFWLLFLPAGLCLLLILFFKRYKTNKEIQDWPHPRFDHWLGIVTGYAIGIFLVHYVLYFLLIK